MTQPDITISLPIYIRLGKRKVDRFSLNLNTYRNAHFHTLNKAKEIFDKIVAQRIGHLPVMTKVDLTYRLFFGSKRWIDISNICCIVDKFFCDTLVNQNKLINDSMNHIVAVNFRWGGVDTKDPRVEVTLSNIQLVKDDTPMQIILTREEIEEAIRDLVQDQITIREDQTISISFQGIVEARFVANVVIQKMTEETVVPKKVRTRRSRTEDRNDDQAEEPVEEKAQLSVEELVTTQPVFAQPGDPATIISKATSAIFPDVNSSAPVNETVAATPPTKSLFSNLTKPVHDTKE